MMVERGLTGGLRDHLALSRAVRADFESAAPTGTTASESILAETYIRIAGNRVYLYRAVDSAGDTNGFMLSPNRDLVAAKLFLELALHRTGCVRPRLINIDGHPVYASAIAEVKQSRGWEDGPAAGHRGTCPGVGSSFHQRGDCRRPLIPVGGRRAEYDRGVRIDAHDPKSQIQWLPKGDVVGQVRFIHQVCGIATDMLAVFSRFSLEFLFAPDLSDKVDFH